jgi:hypothetical protein
MATLRPRRTSGGSGTTNTVTHRHPRGGAPRSNAGFRLGKDGDGDSRNRPPLFVCIRMMRRRISPREYRRKDNDAAG